MKTKLTQFTNKSKFSFKKNLKVVVGTTINPNEEYGGEFLPVTVVDNSILLLDTGEIGGYAEDYGFYTCREEFHEENMNRDNKNKTILFTHNRKFKELSRFLSIIENKLKIAPTKQSIVHDTHDKASLIEISDWWNQNEIRQQFFTILIRAACNFKMINTPQEIERTLKSNRYFDKTYVAVELFINGFNKQNSSDDIDGWYYTFTDTNAKPLTQKETLTILKK